MKFRQKLIYIAIGFLFASLGYLVATLTAELNAQENTTHFDEITCRALAILDDQGNIVIGLVADELGGKLSVTDKNRERQVGLGINPTAGHIGISNSGGTPVAVISTTPTGEGIMWTTEESGKLATWSSSPSKLVDAMKRQHYR